MMYITCKFCVYFDSRYPFYVGLCRKRTSTRNQNNDPCPSCHRTKTRRKNNTACPFCNVQTGENGIMRHVSLVTVKTGENRMLRNVLPVTVQTLYANHSTALSFFLSFFFLNSRSVNCICLLMLWDLFTLSCSLSSPLFYS